MALHLAPSLAKCTFLQQSALDQRAVLSVVIQQNLSRLPGDGTINSRRNWMVKTRLDPPRASFNLEFQGQWLAESGQIFFALVQNGALAVKNMVSLIPYDAVDNDVEGFLHKLLAVSLPSVGMSTAALAIIAGAAFYVTTIIPPKKSHVTWGNRAIADQPVKDCLLIMSPTPFNRFVLMRCPSIAFEETDVYEGLAEILTTERRHFVSLENGDGKWSGTLLRVASEVDETSRFIAGSLKKAREQEASDSASFYQRTCLHTEDGGVLAIDWPSHLELSGEHGLDTTVFLVPGSANGSGDQYVRSFVRRALRCGYFPIVLNPRGCAGSPLTTPRLFTAGDSDDIRAAVHFVIKSRPWTTIMGVGWGYGANMLVKYLGEEAAATPLTAAVCLENPFDMDESTNFFRHDGFRGKEERV